MIYDTYVADREEAFMLGKDMADWLVQPILRDPKTVVRAYERLSDVNQHLEKKCGILASDPDLVSEVACMTKDLILGPLERIRAVAEEIKSGIWYPVLEIVAIARDIASVVQAQIYIRSRIQDLQEAGKKKRIV